MKRIIYSIFNDNVKSEGDSLNDYKRNQFIQHKQKLIECKQHYAKLCGAEYRLFSTGTDDYADIQFEKIRFFEELADDYDEILYLDFDIIPTAIAANIFDEVETDKIAMFPVAPVMQGSTLREAIISNGELGVDHQNMFVKMAAKKSMLELNYESANDLVYNTGVILGNKKVAKELNFTANLEEMKELLYEAKEDSFFPEEITKWFVPNNEVFISYLIEKNQVPHTDLPASWNFIMDHDQLTYKAVHFLHVINKDFSSIFESLVLSHQ